MELRTALTAVKQEDKLHVDIGGAGLTAFHFSGAKEKIVSMEGRVHERPVQMPDRWVRALGNAAEIHRSMKPAFTLKGAQAQAFAASLPSATGKNQAGWLAPSRMGATLTPRRAPNAAYVSGLHRLSALKRVMTNISEMTFYRPEDGEPGPFMVEVELPGTRLTLSLTAEAWHGYSGEGSLLASLAQQDVLEDAESISSMLEFDAVIDEMKMAQRWNMDGSRVQAALALLAVSGKLGYDAHDRAYFHRELPDDPNRVLKDNPRLVAARKLVDAVKSAGENRWIVRSGESDYLVYFDPAQGAHNAKCTCTWYLNHQNKRGPCKHILAVQLKEEAS
jgi:predicted nucleic acid-binding Zn finger protein